MKKTLSIFVTFVFVLIGVASCGSSSQVEIGMDKNKLLNEIYECLITNTIDIDKVNSLLHEYYEIANVILDSGEVYQDYNMMVLAENSILFANRHRYHLSDVDSQLAQAETYFQNGDFQNASMLASNVLKRIRESNGR